MKGSPFVVMAEKDTNPPSKPSVGQKCDVDFDILDLNLPQDLKFLEASLTRPKGRTEPIQCTCTPENTLGLEFTPEEAGKHVIEVKKRDFLVKGSPFVIMVENNVASDSKPTVGHKCEVDFDIPDVTLPRDLKDLKAKLSRPSGVTEEIPCTCTSDNTLGLEFTPEEPGKHVMEVTKRGHPVKGSPFEVMVEVDEVRTDEVPTDEVPTDEIRTDEVPTDEVRTDEVHTDEVRTDEVRTDEVPTDEVPAVASECDVNLEIPGVTLAAQGSVETPKRQRILHLTRKRPCPSDSWIQEHALGSPFEVTVSIYHQFILISYQFYQFVKFRPIFRLWRIISK